MTSLPTEAPPFVSELTAYLGRIREFDRTDWQVYVGWVGLFAGLVCASGGFLLFGRAHGVIYGGEAWLVPVGASIFAVSIAVDTVGHRTLYKAAIRRAESLVHGITIFCGVGSCVLLCAAYSHRDTLWVPAMVLTLLSLLYSVVDEAFHWQRYVSQRSDRVEMWSHVGILTGHGIMMLGWWAWFFGGYPGVAETVRLLRESW